MGDAIEVLRRWGCDTAGALDRVLGDRALYQELVAQVTQTDECARLGEAIAAGDAQEAFELAHMLKGMLGNMGLTPLYTPVCEIVELLRPGRMADVAEPYARLCEGYQRLIEIVNEAEN